MIIKQRHHHHHRQELDLLWFLFPVSHSFILPSTCVSPPPKTLNELTNFHETIVEHHAAAGQTSLLLLILLRTPEVRQTLALINAGR
jgi:hypothetical protein